MIDIRHYRYEPAVKLPFCGGLLPIVSTEHLLVNALQATSVADVKHNTPVYENANGEPFNAR
jgi:hypothetical protein